MSLLILHCPTASLSGQKTQRGHAVKVLLLLGLIVAGLFSLWLSCIRHVNALRTALAWLDN